MIKFSEQTNLLEQHNYHYQLQDVEEPNLYRELFDYESVPKISFNHREVPMFTPKELWITDTTFRDGPAVPLSLFGRADSSSLQAACPPGRT